MGGGASAANYANDPSVTNPKTAQALGVDVANGFMSGASFSPACTMMMSSSTPKYQLNGAACTTNARYICMKPCMNKILDTFTNLYLSVIRNTILKSIIV